MKKRIVLCAIVSVLLVACTRNQTPESTPMPTPMSDSNATDTSNQTPATQSAVLGASQSAKPAASAVPVAATRVTVVTSRGSFVIELDAEHAPGTVSNFLRKATENYYKGLKFHRVEDWVVQGGDPLGNGTGGGPMPTELSDVAFVEGSVGVARGGDIRVSNDSQFFICTTDCAWLTGQYTNFGKVVSGMDVVKKIAIGDTITSISPVK